MKKLMIILIIGIFLLSLNKVEGMNDACSACNEGIGCGEGYECRINDDCVDNGGDLKCESRTYAEGEFGEYSTYSDCKPVGSGTKCVYVDGFRDKCTNTPSCSNEYSCNGDTLTVRYKSVDCDGVNNVCKNVGIYSIDCKDLQECNDAENSYGESCSCINSQGCKYPTNFIKITGATGTDCGDITELYDGFEKSLNLGEIWTDSAEFFDDGRVWWFANDGGGDNVWSCDSEKSVVLDLGDFYDVYAIRAYGDGVEYYAGEPTGHSRGSNSFNIKLEYSKDNNNFYEVYNGDITHNPNFENYGGRIRNDYANDYYFLIKYNMHPADNEIYLNAPVNARYLRYTSTKGGEIVVEGKYTGGVLVDNFDNNLNNLVNNYNILLAAKGVDKVRVLDYSDLRCCADIGEIPQGDYGVCCSGMPTEGPNGACGCPTGFDWIDPTTDPITGEYIPGSCDYIPARCSNSCTIQQLLINPEQCLRNIPIPYEDSCCFDVNYGGEDYFNWKNIEVY